MMESWIYGVLQKCLFKIKKNMDKMEYYNPCTREDLNEHERQCCGNDKIHSCDVCGDDNDAPSLNVYCYDCMDHYLITVDDNRNEYICQQHELERLKKEHTRIMKDIDRYCKTFHTSFTE